MPISNTDVFLDEIKYSYTCMQMSLFMELFTKTSHSELLINAAKSKNEYSIEIGAQNYLLRNDYISYGFETSLRNKQNWGILGDMAIIQSFSYISSRFSELIESDKQFATYIEGLFISKGYDYNAFYSILRFIRNLSVHGSTNKDYVLKNEDFQVWKEYHSKKGISTIELHLNIVDKLHKLDLVIKVDELVEGYNISKIFNGYNMFMFIELCMNVISGFKNEHS